MQKKLVAKSFILYNSTNYKPGDELPANNAAMVDAWLSAGTACWMTEGDKESVKARTATAEPGLAGLAIGSDADNGENLVGRVPKTAARKKK